jgi:two-component system response regulator AtoC
VTTEPPSLSRVLPKASEVAELGVLFSFNSKMRDVWEIIVQVASTTATVLIRGESGVGKDLIARAIHAMSARADGPFVKVSCAALPAALLESELFGHEKGAFTGAFRQKLGQFEYANRGTICLDEIGEMPCELQAKLLHVIQDLQFSRVGGQALIRADVRIVATTNRDLEAAISEGAFREDLYYRLNVIEIMVPPLRDRRETIPLLANSFLRRFNLEYRRDVQLSPELARQLREHSWPGNVRELENAIRRLVVMGSDRVLRETLARNDAPLRFLPGASTPREEGRPAEDLGLKAIARRAARDAERMALLEVLERVRWNRTEAARVLKVSYKTLLSKLAENGITPTRPKGDT